MMSLDRATITVAEKYGLRQLVKLKDVAEQNLEDVEEAVIPGMPTEADLDIGEQIPGAQIGPDQRLQVTSKPDDTPAPTRAPAPVQPPIALPKTEAELKDGTVYSTSRGPARWDAAKQKFFLVK